MLSKSLNGKSTPVFSGCSSGWARAEYTKVRASAVKERKGKSKTLDVDMPICSVWHTRARKHGLDRPRNHRCTPIEDDFCAISRNQLHRVHGEGLHRLHHKSSPNDSDEHPVPRLALRGLLQEARARWFQDMRFPEGAPNFAR